MFKIGCVLYISLFFIYSEANQANMKLKPQIPPATGLEVPSLSGSLQRIKETIALYTLTMLTCKPMETLDRKCETCECDALGKNFNCVSKMNEPCKAWRWYSRNKKSSPGSPDFACHRRDLMHNRFESCSMCSCAENGKQIKCTYGQSTVCIYPDMVLNPRSNDPKLMRPW